MKDLKSFSDAYIEEEEYRQNIDFGKLCNYGIKVLDDPLIAIAKNELVVVGADSGVGKSSLAITIAQHNAKNGRKVALYYLEGGHIEAMQRMKWQDMADFYYKNKTAGRYSDMDYRKWVLNNPDDKRLMLELSAEVYEEQKKKYKDNLFLYPITEGFKIEELLDSLVGFHKLVESRSGEFKQEGVYDLDLIIIDHLQYFSLGKEDHEITEITRIIRECKRITDHYRIPIILVSHLRKKNKDRGLPDQEDFYGSSNIPKIATTAITITPFSAGDNLSSNVYPTFFRVVKSRIGLRPNYAMLCDYNLTRRQYADRYQIFRLDSMGNFSDTPLADNELPKWAKV